MFPGILSWEMATLIETLICLAIFILSGYVSARTKEHAIRMAGFFKQITTAITESEKPTIEPRFKSALNGLFAIAFAISAFLFILMSLPSLELTSGLLSLASGVICIALAILLWFLNKDKSMMPEKETEKKLTLTD